MEKINDEKWLMPTYYKNFRCKCKNCRHTCCHGWQIPISKEEYFTLINRDVNEDLRHRLDVSFIAPEIEDDYRYRIIAFNYLGDCPMQKDGLCQIHKELGENSLPTVCKLYPRSLKRVNGINVACCSSSCEKIVEMLIDGEFRIVEDKIDAKPQLTYEVNEDIIKELKDFEKIISDNESLKEAIAKICILVNSEEFNKDLNTDANVIEDGLYILNRLKGDETLSCIVDEINNRYTNNYQQYEIDKVSFDVLFPKWNDYFKNVINNSLLYENFPFVDDRFDKTLAYKGLCASYGLLRLVCVGYTSIHQTKEDLVDCISALFHLIDHTAFYYNINVISKHSALLLKL